MRDIVCAYSEEHEENGDCGGVHTWVYAEAASSDAPTDQVGEGGSQPTPPLQP